MAAQRTVPVVALGLANSRRPRRPAGAKAANGDDPLASPGSAQGLLRELGVLSGAEEELSTQEELPLEDLRALREAVERIIGALASVAKRAAAKDRGVRPAVPADARYVLNGMAARCPWALSVNPDLTFTETATGRDLAGLVASLCVRELSGCDPTRLKACERRECRLFFYDTTRNRSARWHAENPCGWRERAGRRSSSNEETGTSGGPGADGMQRLLNAAGWDAELVSAQPSCHTNSPR